MEHLVVDQEEMECFKAYDIRGRVPDQLNEDVAYRIGKACASYVQGKTAVIGADIRLTSDALKHSLAKGLAEMGMDVIDLGMTGTEEIYFATSHLGADLGVQVTASHNPKDYNGMKLVGRNSVPISGDTGLFEIKRLAEENHFSTSTVNGEIKSLSVTDAYVDHLLSYVDLDALRPLSIVVNSGNGAAGHVIDALEKRFNADNVPVTFIKVHHEPDGTFPHGIPNPLLPECREDTAVAVKSHDADLGLAWDGDFDRCFFFDETAGFIEGYYIVGLLAEVFLQRNPGEKIIHDPRLVWNTQAIVKQIGGKAIETKTGHAFIKERMRSENAIYGGEMSAHHYFRDFFYCDSGMIPWLIIIEVISRSGMPLSQLIAERMEAFPCSGEMNFRVENAADITRRVVDAFKHEKPIMSEIDGVSLEFKQWRFNLRSSNTEPLLRLNVETRGDKSLLDEKVSEIRMLIQGNA